MKIILSLILFSGLATALSPHAGKAKTVALWSDFKAFESRVLADPAGERVLSYGGENQEDSFSILLDRLFHLHESSSATVLGLVTSVLAVLGFLIEFKSKEPFDGKADKSDTALSIQSSPRI